MSEEVVGVRVALRYSDPKIWRRFQLPIYVSLTVLHDIIKVAFDWDGSHMSAFYIGRESYMADFGWGEFDESLPHSDFLSLQDVIDKKARQVRYIYDFGDTWEHSISFGKVRVIDTPMTAPELLGGARTAPIEDCGGFYTYERYIEMLNDPDYEKTHEYDEEDPAWWMKDTGFDPERFDEDGLREELKKISLYEPNKPEGSSGLYGNMDESDLMVQEKVDQLLSLIKR